MNTPASGPSTPVNPMAQAILRIEQALAELKLAVQPVGSEVAPMLLELAMADAGFDDLDLNDEPTCEAVSRRCDAAQDAILAYARQVAGLPPRDA